MNENTDTPIMDAANQWNDRRDLLAQIGILERQLARDQNMIAHLERQIDLGKLATSFFREQRNKLAKALRGLVGECEYQSKAGDFNADRIELNAAKQALASMNHPEETKP